MAGHPTKVVYAVTCTPKGKSGNTYFSVSYGSYLTLKRNEPGAFPCRRRNAPAVVLAF